MASADGNRDAARELVELGRAALARGEVDVAIRRLSKAQRMCPDAETEGLLKTAMARAEAKAASASGANEEGTANGEDARDGEASSSTVDPSPLGSSSGGGVRQRRPNGTVPHSGESSYSHEQLTLVKRILSRSTNFYEVLELTKTCTEEEVKRSYRKLSLKVHPDKNKAPGAEDAFKAVSRAFKCLSDGRLRANYDEYGHEDPMQSRMQQQQQRARQQYNGAHPFGGHPFFQEDIDPNDIFNAFFGIHTMNGRVYVNRGGFPFQQHQQQRRNRAAGAAENEGDRRQQWAGLMQLVPLLLFFLFFIGLNTDPVYKHQPTTSFAVEFHTAHWKVPYFVKSKEKFEQTYPSGSAARWKLERGIEGEYKESLEQHCYHERLQKWEVQRWRGAEQAKQYTTPHCDELHRLPQYV